ncbi:unnamed protein product, partial [Scytosiphon promiscuus]
MAAQGDGAGSGEYSGDDGIGGGKAGGHGNDRVNLQTFRETRALLTQTKERARVIDEKLPRLFYRALAIGRRVKSQL